MGRLPFTLNPQQAAAHAPHLPYLPGLDGLRALAVIAVLLYHSDLRWLPGGFLGVEVFFVLSGYLITSILVAEWNTQQTIDLKRFWLSRARRLLPALFVVIAGALGLGVVLLPDEVASLRADAVASLGYVTNWYLILAEKSYFETFSRPSLLRHLWSLAVEEQFYLLFPPLLVILLRALKPRQVLLVLLAGAAASAALMLALYQPDVDPSRVYYGTDTRAGGLLIGAALAFAWAPGHSNTRRLQGWALDILGLGALTFLVLMCLRINEFEPFLYQGGLLAVASATAVVIVAVVGGNSLLGNVILGIRPLLWIGVRSYSIYLWHWIVFNLTRPQLDVPLSGMPLFVVQVAATLVLADLSYRFVETPIRRGALGQAWDTWRQAQGSRRRWLSLLWADTVGMVALIALVLCVSVVQAEEPPPPAYLMLDANVVTAPQPSAPAENVAAAPLGYAAVEPVLPSHHGDNAGSMPTPAPSATLTITPPPQATATLTRVPATSTPSTRRAASARVFAMGDSVMLGANAELQRVLGAVEVDAAVSRQVTQALQILEARRKADALGNVVVLHLGNNGPYSAKQVKATLALLTGVQRVVIVTAKVPRTWEKINNEALANEAKQHKNVVIADWWAASAEHPEYFWKDGIHLRPAGARAYAELIAAAVNAP